MIYFTSDQHFFLTKHAREGFWVGERTFHTAASRDAFLLARWNETVSPEDEVYVLGDFSEGDGARTDEILARLHGKKYLLIGNNDPYLADPAFPRERFVWCRHYYELHALDTKFVLFHFPIEAWSGYAKDRVHLHGHLHRHRPIYEPIRRYEVGVEAHDGRPVSLETVWKVVEPLHNANRTMPF